MTQTATLGEILTAKGSAPDRGYVEQPGEGLPRRRIVEPPNRPQTVLVRTEFTPEEKLVRVNDQRARAGMPPLGSVQELLELFGGNMDAPASSEPTPPTEATTEPRQPWPEMKQEEPVAESKRGRGFRRDGKPKKHGDQTNRKKFDEGYKLAAVARFLKYGGVIEKIAREEHGITGPSFHYWIDKYKAQAQRLNKRGGPPPSAAAAPVAERKKPGPKPSASNGLANGHVGPAPVLTVRIEGLDEYIRAAVGQQLATLGPAIELAVAAVMQKRFGG